MLLEMFAPEHPGVPTSAPVSHLLELIVW